MISGNNVVNLHSVLQSFDNELQAPIRNLLFKKSSIKNSNRRFGSNFSKITRPVAAIKSLPQICLVITWFIVISCSWDNDSEYQPNTLAHIRYLHWFSYMRFWLPAKNLSPFIWNTSLNSFTRRHSVSRHVRVARVVMHAGITNYWLSL